MTSDRDLKQDRRRSFFLFGSVNLGKSEPTTRSSNSIRRKPSVSKPATSKGPLEKQPLSNKNPFLENDESANAVSKSDCIPITEIEASKDLETPKRASTNPFTHTTTPPSIPNARVRARKPPPPIDMSVIRVFTQAAPLNTMSSKNTSQSSSTEETLKSASHSPMKTPVPSKIPVYQHKRQRSEAEKLVDDLDEYIKQHEDSGSLDPHVEKPKDWQESDQAHSSSEQSSEVPLGYVEPLNIGPDDGKIPSMEGSLGNRSDVGSEREADRFSFTDSLNDKSVNSIQQVAMSELTGAAPILMNLHYGSPSISSSDQSRSPERSLDRGRDNGRESSSEVARFSSSDDEFQDVEQQPISELSSRARSKSPKRVFRVVNEDRPHFYFQTADNTTVSTADSTITDENDEDEQAEGELKADDQKLCRSDESSQDFGKSLPPSSPVLSYTASQVEDTNDALRVQSINKGFEPVTPASFNERDAVDSLLEAGALTVKSDEEADIIKPTISTTTDNAAVRSTPSLKSRNSNYTTSSDSSKPDKTVRLVSSYVEELRLKYYKSSNFLAAPPNLPISLKQKNNLIQPKNIKVRIRTSSKQIGIKHGGAKQKLLSLETANEDSRESFSGVRFNSSKNRINVDHTKEFHNLLAREGLKKTSNGLEAPQHPAKDDEYYLDDIPGDDAYDSDDAMAPLREGNGSGTSQSVGRSNTVVSYYTKNQRRFRSGTLDNGYAHLQDLPTNININDYEDKDSQNSNAVEDLVVSDDSNSILPALSYGQRQGLHVANPDTDSD